MQKGQETKARMNAYADLKRRTKPHSLNVGDHTLVKQRIQNKASPRFEPVPYTILDVKWSMITAKRTTDQKLVTRNSSFFKKLPNPLMEVIQESSPVPQVELHKPRLILMDQNPLNSLKCQLLKKSFVRLPQVKPAPWKTTTCLPQWNNHHHLPSSPAVEGESGNRNGPRTVLWTKDFAMTISWTLVT